MLSLSDFDQADIAFRDAAFGQVTFTLTSLELTPVPVPGALVLFLSATLCFLPVLRLRKST